MSTDLKAIMLVDPVQVLQRVPASYFLKKETAADIFDGIFGPRDESLSESCITELVRRQIQLEFVDPKDLDESKSRTARVVIAMDTVPDQLLKRLKSITLRILFVYESVIMDKRVHQEEYQRHFTHVLSYRNLPIPGIPFFKYEYPVRDDFQKDVVPFSERKFCCMIASSKTSNWDPAALKLRENFIRFFSEKHSADFDLWGAGWDKTDFANSASRKGLFHGSKHKVMCKYRFTFCPENIGTVEDYITEKIWHAFRNGVIPIYMGPPNVDSYIPKRCYIDLRDYIQEGGELDTERLYSNLCVISEDQFNRFLEKIATFLASDSALKFSPKVFTQKFADVVSTVVNKAS